MRFLLAAALSAGLALPSGPALAFQAQNSFTVVRIDAQRFEVRPRGGLGASDAWCAAGDFVIRGLRLPPATPIWRISEPPRPSGRGIVFSLSDQGAATTTGLVRLGSGASITANHGQTLCQSTRDLQRNR